MAAYTVENTHGGVRIVTWSLTTADGTGTQLIAPMYADKSIQVYGTFGGTTVIIEGSNDSGASTFFTLNDPQGNALSLTSATGEQILENTYLVRPRLSGGAGATVTVKLLLSTPTEFGNTLT